MLDLEPKTGLPISINDEGILDFGSAVAPIVPAHRTIEDMRPYLADPNAGFAWPSVYDMYRNVRLRQDDFSKQNLRFDITVFHPGTLGKEFCKTIGHLHPFKPGTTIRYPETYEVVLGKALFLMQKMDDSFSEVLDVCAIEVNEGEDVIFLPGYAHFLINPTDGILITSNWSADNFESEYEPVKKHHGAAYYVIKGNDDKAEFIKNPSYKSAPELKILKPKELPHFGLIKGQPAYLTGQKSPDMLQFLISPELFIDQLTVDQCYSLI